MILDSRQEVFVLNGERNYGIDLVKVVAAGYVILLHSFNIGGVVNNTSGIGFALAWWINLLAYSAVDIFAVVTGFCSYSDTAKPIKFTRCVTLFNTAFNLPAII